MPKPTVILLSAFVICACAMQSLHAQDSASTAAMPRPDHSDSWVRVQGDTAAVQLDVRQTSIANVLSALAQFDITFVSRVQLDEIFNGTYAGPRSYVISRLLGRYDYTIKQDKSKLELTIYGEHGERVVAVPASVPAPTRRRPTE